MIGHIGELWKELFEHLDVRKLQTPSVWSSEAVASFDLSFEIT